MATNALTRFTRGARGVGAMVGGNVARQGDKDMTISCSLPTGWRSPPTMKETITE